LLAVARRVVDAEEDAEDAVQRAWYCVVRSVKRFRGDCRLSTWLHRVVLNAARMQRRAVTRRRAATEEARRETARHGAGDSEADAPWRRAATREQRRRLAAALDLLPAGQREPLRLHHGADLPLAEVASLTSATVASVDYSLRRARQRLRAWLSDGGSGPRSAT
jgi:RNA polymerase sigma-70 factor (ECF subfamily)